MIAASAATALLLLDVTVVYLAAPAIGAGLDASFTELQWVVDAYALAMAAVLLPAGALADRRGRRRTFLIGLALFAAGSAWCAAASSAPMLDIARALQGVGGACLFATSLGLIGGAYEGRALASALGVWGAASGVALAAGPVVGGIVVEGLDWRWIFWLNLPACLALGLLALRRVPESRDPAAPPPDALGSALAAGSLLLLVGALLQGNERGWSSPEIVAAVVAAAALLVAFAAHERRTRHPLIEPGLWRSREFSLTAVVTLLQSVAIYPVLLFLALELQGVYGFDALEAGLRVLPVTAALLVVAPVAGRLTHRLPVSSLLAAGLLVTSLGLLVTAGAELADGWSALLPGFVVLGVGIGILSPALAAAIVGMLPAARAGLASGIGNTFRQAGIALGVALFGVVFKLATPDDPALALVLVGGEAGSDRVALEFHDGVRSVLLVAAGIAFAGALVALALRRAR